MAKQSRHRRISIKRGFVEVDARFAREWPIPYAEVRAAWKKMDGFLLRYPDLDYSVCGLLQLVAPDHLDKLYAVRDIAEQHKRSRECD